MDITDLFGECKNAGPALQKTWFQGTNRPEQINFYSNIPDRRFFNLAIIRKRQHRAGKTGW